MVKQTSRNICFDEAWSNGYGVRIPDIPYIFERISSDMTASVQCIENFDEIVKRIENGHFDPECRYRIRPFEKPKADSEYLILSRKQRDRINRKIALIFIMP